MALFDDNILYSGQNVRRTRALFKEVCMETDTPVMTLGRRPDPNYVSLRDLFIQMVEDDPTETAFAEFVFGDVAHWKLITEATWMKPYLEEWRLITDARRKAKAFKGILSEVETGGRSAFTAAKYLIEEPWKDKRAKETKEHSRKSTDLAREEVSADIARLKDYLVR